MIDWENVNFFKEKEFLCPCCGVVKINSRLIELLDEARAIANVPFKINSAYRCSKHNTSVNGSLTSSHKKGLAVDIRVSTSFQRFQILNALNKVGFNRIGVYKNFIHVDIDDDKTQNVIWYV